MNNKPIGIFDSGIGGLTVVKEVIKALPYESIIYLGDTARVPYGSRSKEVITKFAKDLVRFLLEKKVKCLVVACNTISTTCLEEIERISPVPVIGVADPAVEEAVKTTKNKKIGVIGTARTISSRVYEQQIHNLDNAIEVLTQACPLFVPLAEEGLSAHKATKIIAQGYLKDLKNKRIDTLILACTHYPLLRETIQQVLGEEVVLIDSAKPTAQKLKKLLTEKKLTGEKKKAKYKFYVTDAPEKVIEVAGRFFGEGLDGNISKVNLQDL